jgi:hypothetical protein
MWRETNRLAVLSLVSALVSWVVLPGVAAVIAVILGHLARRQIRETGEQGGGLALVGLLLGYINLLTSVIGVVIGVLFWTAIVAYLTYGSP